MKKILVVTLIVLLILAGVSLNGLFSEKGLFSRTENASNRYNEAKAREVLETVLLTDGQFEKNTNQKYNQEEFLNDLIKNEIPGTNIRGDVAIVDGWGFELDRSVPKIGRRLGRADKLVFPTVTVSNPQLATDYRTSTFTVTAIEETNGINRIEIWLNGEKIETLDKTYNNVKTEIIENFTVNKNGTYTVKVYGDLTESAKVEVTGIVPAVEFTPNGSEEWKKEHTTKITVKETGEKVTSLKYKWTTSGTNAPSITEFIEECPTDNIITKKDITGTYYLWVLLTTETGKTNICGSEGFNFDNEGPTVTLNSKPISDTSFKLIATATDNHSGPQECKFYVEGKLQETKDISEGKAECSVTVDKMEEIECYVEVSDKLENYSIAQVNGRALLYAWNVYTAVETYTWSPGLLSNGTNVLKNFKDTFKAYECWAFCESNGYFVAKSSAKTTNVYDLRPSWAYNVTLPNRKIFTSSGWCGTDWTNCKVNLYVRYYEAERHTTISRGSLVRTVYARNSSAYPTGQGADGYIYESLRSDLKKFKIVDI